ncbi:MAG: pyrroline-5-carboxylate reductase [Ruminococcus sp.]|nr:pyrroline-5-carboxylate reductase [Ruminococcus sp.]
MKNIGFIGAGNMATAIINGLISNKAVEANNVNIFDLDKEKLNLIKQKGINTITNSKEVVKNSDIIVLAVKPQNYSEVLQELKEVVNENKIFVSIAAGISISYVRNELSCNCPMVRVMPNTPLLLGKGATALCPSENISADDFETIKNMFALSGTVEVFTEDHMNEIISVNGSSPAYIYLFAKVMADYAKSCNIDYDKAMNLICATLEGSAEMLRNSGDSAETLIEKVSSKGGTTIAALNKLREYKFEEAITQAMKACTDRAEELGK